MKLISILFSTSFLCVFAQQTTTFEDQFGKQGVVSHEGTWSDSLLPKEGRFDLKWRSTLNNDSLITYLAKGRLSDHMPSGSWTWEEASWDYTVEIGNSILPEFSTTGIHHIWKGAFKAGVPHGKWIYGQGSPILRIERRDTPLRIEVGFKNGVVNGEVIINDKRSDNEIVITGHTDANGIVTGTWEFNYFCEVSQQVTTEIRKYNNGILTERILNRDTIVYLDAISKLKQIQEGDSSIVLGEKKYLKDIEESKGVELLSEYMNEYFLKGWKLDIFSYDFVRHPLFYKRFAYPLNENELAKRLTIKTSIEDLINQVKTHLSKGNVYINRSRSKELDLAISALEIAIERLKIIDSLVGFSHLPDFIYLDRRNGGLIDWASELQKTTVFKGIVYPEYQDSFQEIDLIQNEWKVFELSIELLENLKKQLPAYFNQVNKSFEALNREGELQALENKMMQELKMLDSLYIDKKNFEEHIHQYWIYTFLTEQIKEYANTDDYEDALMLGNKLTKKMEYLLEWNEEWEMINTIQKDLKESYINYAYNPYNGEHDIQLPIKKRFIVNVQSKMIPWMIAELENAKEWDEFKTQWDEFKLMRNYLIKFAQINDRSDRRLERKIRREDSPERIYKLFFNHMEKHMEN